MSLDNLYQLAAELGQALLEFSGKAGHAQLREALSAPISTLDLRSPNVVNAETDLTVNRIRDLMRPERMCYVAGIMPSVDQKPIVRWTVTERNVATKPDLRRENFGEELIVSYVTREVYTVSPEDPIGHALWVMAVRGVRRLVVIDDNDGSIKLIAVNDIFRQLGAKIRNWAAQPTFKGVFVYDIARFKDERGVDKEYSAVVFIRDDYGMSIADAAKLMRDRRVGSLLVLNADGGLVGIVSEVDIALANEELHPARTDVVAIMTQTVASVFSDCKIVDAIDLMLKHNCRHLPVVARGSLHPIGVVSPRDVVRMFEQAELLGPYE